MYKPLEQKLPIVTGLENDGQALVEEKSVGESLEILNQRARRLVNDRQTCEKLQPVLREFVTNLIEFFQIFGELDDFVLKNIMTALVTADCHGPSPHGVENYSTFIRRLNPADPDTHQYFIIGRAGSIHDRDCPLGKLEKAYSGTQEIPAAQLHMYRAYFHARSCDITRDAPRISVQDFGSLVPDQIKYDSVLEEAFLDVVFSDGAWELYQTKLAA